MTLNILKKQKNITCEYYNFLATLIMKITWCMLLNI